MFNLLDGNEDRNVAIVRWIFAILLTLAFLAGIGLTLLATGCKMTDPPQTTTWMDRDNVVRTLSDHWGPQGWVIVAETSGSVIFERLPDAGERAWIGSGPLRISVTITSGGIVSARCSSGNRDLSTGRWAKQVQQDLEMLLP